MPLAKARKGLVDGALAPDRLASGVGVLHHIITVTETATGLALFDPAADAAMRLGGEVLQEQRIHRALEADRDSPSLTVTI